MKPTQPYRALRAFVATVVIGVLLGLWVYGHLEGPPLGTLWDVIILILAVASCYTIYGRRTMDAAVETAQDLKGNSSDSDNEEASDGDA